MYTHVYIKMVVRGWMTPKYFQCFKSTFTFHLFSPWNIILISNTLKSVLYFIKFMMSTIRQIFPISND